MRSRRSIVSDMPDDVLKRLMGVGQHDQTETALGHGAKVLMTMYRAFVREGFTEDQAFVLTRDWYIIFSKATIANQLRGKNP
jgi:hypothetical protein